jgi:hypothetical protein
VRCEDEKEKNVKGKNNFNLFQSLFKKQHKLLQKMVTVLLIQINLYKYNTQ